MEKHASQSAKLAVSILQLPGVQGVSPSLAYRRLPAWQCPHLPLAVHRQQQRRPHQACGGDPTHPSHLLPVRAVEVDFSRQKWTGRSCHLVGHAGVPGCSRGGESRASSSRKTGGRTSKNGPCGIWRSAREMLAAIVEQPYILRLLRLVALKGRTTWLSFKPTN